jgi:putative ABC transport system permease protein
VLLSRVLAGKLGLGAGDVVDVEILEGERRTRALPVSAVVDDLMGVSAILDIDALARFVSGPDLVSGAELRLDTREEASVLAALRGRGLIASVVMHQAALDSFREQLDKSLGVMQRIEVIFAFIIAFAVVFNGARTALSERARELATLRVLGFSNGEVAVVLLGELFVVTALAIPCGLLLGAWLSRGLLAASASDLIRLPYVATGATFATASLVVASSAIVSALVVGTRVGSLDLVGVLKTRD